MILFLRIWSQSLFKSMRNVWVKILLKEGKFKTDKSLVRFSSGWLVVCVE
jgi:hypothetical protein